MSAHGCFFYFDNELADEGASAWFIGKNPFQFILALNRSVCSVTVGRRDDRDAGCRNDQVIVVTKG